MPSLSFSLQSSQPASSNLAAIASPLLYPLHQRAPSLSRQEVSRKINCMDGAAEAVRLGRFTRECIKTV
ncbi:hypothetical protein ZWY2020_012087 [Hordeum vulgare]|nr:hypothetical protein ZWY2020_012087 [Hordeum vulgare]